MDCSSIEETIHVPLMVKLPGGRRGGTRVAAPVQHIDLLPTFAALAGFSSPAGLRGRNLQPLLTGSGTIAPQGIYSRSAVPALSLRLERAHVAR